MEITVKANHENKTVDLLDRKGNILLTLDREASMFLPALIRVKAIEVWSS